MSLHCLATGALWKEPEQRVSKSTGNPFTAATLRIKDGDSAIWIKLLAFATDIQDELLKLCDGDSVSCQGALSAEIYAPPGREPRINLTLFIDAILPLRRQKPPKPKAPKQAADDRRESAPFNDDLPSNMEEAR